MRRAGVFRDDQLEESLDGLGERFRLLVAIYYDYQRTPSSLPKEDRVGGLGGGSETGNGAVASGVERAESLLEGGVARQIQKYVSNGGMDQG